MKYEDSLTGIDLDRLARAVGLEREVDEWGNTEPLGSFRKRVLELKEKREADPYYGMEEEILESEEAEEGEEGGDEPKKIAAPKVPVIAEHADFLDTLKDL